MDLNPEMVFLTFTDSKTPIILIMELLTFSVFLSSGIIKNFENKR